MAHKNDPHTEAGEKPPMRRLVKKMGEFIGGHAKAKAASSTALALSERKQDPHAPRPSATALAR